MTSQACSKDSMTETPSPWWMHSSAEDTSDSKAAWIISLIVSIMCAIYVVLSWILDGPSTSLLLWIALGAFFMVRSSHHLRLYRKAFEQM